MPRRVSYPSPQLLAEASPTAGRREDRARGTTWPEHEIEWLIQHYGRFPVKFIAEHLRRSPVAIRIQVCRIRHGRKRQHVEPKQISGNVSRLTG